MTLLAAGDRVAYPDAEGKAFLGTVLDEDPHALNPAVLVSWDDQPEDPQSVPEESLLKVTPVPTAPTPVILAGRKEYLPRLRGWRKYAHLVSLASGLVAVAIGTWALIVIGGLHW